MKKNEVIIKRFFTFTELYIDDKNHLENFKNILKKINYFRNKINLEEKQTGIQMTVKLTNFIDNVKCVYYDFDDKDSKDIEKIEKFELNINDDLDTILNIFNIVSLLN